MRRYLLCGHVWLSCMAKLFEHTLVLIDRIANCYKKEDCNIDCYFWEPMYGQYDDNPYSLGMLPWIEDTDDYSEC